MAGADCLKMAIMLQVSSSLLHAGEVEAAIVDRISALAYTKECRGLVFVGEPLHDVNYIIPTRAESFTLHQKIDEVLLEMRQDGTMEALQARWF